MLILVGLGNPGREYARNRHNIGFRAVDVIHARHRFSPWRARFTAETSEGTIGGDKVFLVKPSTFMNLSGLAVGEAMRFYKLTPANVVAIHDELDLPPAKLRIKTGGSDAGHNGLKSLTQHLGADYRRLRIGIGHPGRRELVSGYVLHDFSKSDEEWIVPLLDAISDHAGLLVEAKDPAFASRVHLALNPDEENSGRERKKPKPAKPLGASPDSPSETASAMESMSPPPASSTGSDSRKPPATPASPPHPEGPLARGLKKLFGR